MSGLKHILLAATLFVGGAAIAGAVPISYNGTLQNGVSQTGTIGNYNSYADLEFWNFYATFDDSVSIGVDRIDSQLDPGFYFFEGLIDDTEDFPSSYLWHDDEVNDPYGGPWGDPRHSSIISSTGWYTIAVREVASWDLPSYRYSIWVNGNTGGQDPIVPEPATLALVGLGLSAAGFVRRRR